MARKTSARVILNRAKVDAVVLAVADGMGEFARQVIEAANVPDAEPFGEGLVTRGGVLAYVGAKKVSGWGIDGRQPKKPRSLRVKSAGEQVQVIGGFGFPARFQEFGTINHSARPFLTPALGATLPSANGIMRDAIKKAGG